MPPLVLTSPWAKGTWRFEMVGRHVHVTDSIYGDTVNYGSPANAWNCMKFSYSGKAKQILRDWLGVRA